MLYAQPKQPTGPLDELYFGRPKRIHVKEFAYVFAIIACLVGIYIGYRYGTVQTPSILLGTALLLVVLGNYAQPFLFPLWRGWMAFAEFLGMIMTFLFMSLTWILLAIPIALLLRIIGKKVMDCTFDRTKSSYWEDREEKQHDFKLLERQF